MSSLQLPSDATMQRTLKVVEKFEEEIASRQAIESNIMILGFGFSGSGPNSAMAFTTLKDWKNRQGITAQGKQTLSSPAWLAFLMPSQ